MPILPDDELTQARCGRDEVQAKLEQEEDEEMVKYFQLVIVQWDKYIKSLEDQHAAREAAVQAEHRA